MKLQFGENFKRFRKEKEITQEKIAEALGVSCQSVSRWELGVCYPDFELLPAIANYFGVTIDSLLSNDELSKTAEKELFFEKLKDFEYGDEKQVDFIRDYCRKYPDDPQYIWQLVRCLTVGIVKDREKSPMYLPILKKNVEKLLDTKYRDLAIEEMINVCDETELEDWLAYVPYHSTFNRRGCLVSRYNNAMDDHQSYIQQGLENLETFSKQLDRRFPDAFGPDRKAKFHYKILGILQTFGDGTQPPDGWKLFYAYKQLVLSACLFGAGKIEEGWREFHSAMEKYKYIFGLKEQYLDLGGELFSDLKVNKNWTEAVDKNGEKHELFAIAHFSFYNTEFLYHFLMNPRWAWFNSVRNTPDYIAAVQWAESMKEKQKKLVV